MFLTSLWDNRKDLQWKCDFQKYQVPVFYFMGSPSRIEDPQSSWVLATDIHSCISRNCLWQEWDCLTKVAQIRWEGTEAQFPCLNSGQFWMAFPILKLPEGSASSSFPMITVQLLTLPHPASFTSFHMLIPRTCPTKPPAHSECFPRGIQPKTGVHFAFVDT